MKSLASIALALCACVPVLGGEDTSFTISKGGSSLTVYGVLDTGVARASHTLGFDPYSSQEVGSTVNAKASKSATGVFNSGASASRWGLRGQVGINHDWRGIFQLESSINIPDGSLSNNALGLAQSKATGPFYSSDSSLDGQLFARAAVLGAASDRWGTLTLGRQMSLITETLPGYDPLQGSPVFSTLGNSGSYGGGGSTESARVDNAIKYRVRVGAFNAGLQHKFGGVSGNSSARTTNQFDIGYEAGPWGIQALYQGFKDTFSAANGASTGSIGLTAFDTTAYTVMARYQAGPVSIRGGWEREKFTDPSDPADDASLTSLYGQLVSSVTVSAYTKNGAESPKVLNVCWFGVVYDVTPRFCAMLGYYQVNQNDYSNHLAVPGSAASGQSRFHNMLLDYRFTKAFDLYAGYMGDAVSGGPAFGSLFKTIDIAGLGARLTF